MNPIELIRERRSSRSFLTKQVEPDKKRMLIEYMQETNTGLFSEKIDFQLIEKSNNNGKSMKLDYGLIKNHSTYILGKTQKAKTARVSYGYLLEKIILKATELKLGTCWVGYFDESYFNEIKTSEHEEIASIVVLGYPTEKLSLGERFSRFSVKAATRKPWKDIFFVNDFNTPLTKDTAGEYSESLEMVRLAPSSGNTQPWRILKEHGNNTYHFYKKPVSKRYEQKGLHEIDMGICIAHFEITSNFKGLKGEWKQLDPNNGTIISVPEYEYVFSWIGN
jgi:nitroreductase